MLGFPKDPGNQKGILPFASQAQESLEMGSALWSVKFPQKAREDALSNAADDPPPKRNDGTEQTENATLKILKIRDLTPE